MKRPHGMFPNRTHIDRIMIARQHEDWPAESRQNVADSLHHGSINRVAFESVASNEDKLGSLCFGYLDDVHCSLDARTRALSTPTWSAFIPICQSAVCR